MEEQAVYRSETDERENALIRYIRKLGYGEILVRVQDGKPVMIEKATEKIKL